ncbi:MAG: ABC transporter permease [Bacteroidales bacterium]|nr:ABC transporter permease [Bacteroidales bacterium]
MIDVLKRILYIGLREIENFLRRPMFVFCMLLAPIATLIFFNRLMNEGVPTKLPCGVVDEDNTTTTRSIVRILSAMEYTDVRAHYANFSDARKAMQRGEIMAFFYIPDGTTDAALSSRRPEITFYTNDCYYIMGSLLMKDMKVTSELAGLAVTRASLQAKGVPPSLMMGILQPIVIETHPLNNPTLNYSIYLNNIVVPSILMIIIMVFTAYKIGIEWKNNTQIDLFFHSGQSSTIALIGKLWPQTLLFSLLFVLIDVCLYKYLGFPCQAGISRMIVLGVLSVLTSEAIAVFIYGIFIQMRLAMSACALLGVLQISLSGFTFPVTAMPVIFQKLCVLIPLRHYYIIYCNQALNGFPLSHVWPSIAILLVMCLLPLTVLWRFGYAFRKVKYKP